MKKVLAILVVAVLSFQCFANVLIFGCYLLNQDYIARELCVNRSTPHVFCKGKCHLKMQLKKQEEQERKLPSGLSGKTEVSPFIHPSPLSVSEPHGTFVVVAGTYTSAASPGIMASIFHPPRIVSIS